jgi:hypothetical protein
MSLNDVRKERIKAMSQTGEAVGPGWQKWLSGKRSSKKMSFYEIEIDLEAKMKWGD